LDFLKVLFKSFQFKNPLSTKIRPMGAELIHADSRTDSLTDMTTLIGVSLRLTQTRKESREEEI
jgi:hypothetical protein